MTLAVVLTTWVERRLPRRQWASNGVRDLLRVSVGRDDGQPSGLTKDRRLSPTPASFNDFMVKELVNDSCKRLFHPISDSCVATRNGTKFRFNQSTQHLQSVHRRYLHHACALMPNTRSTPAHACIHGQRHGNQLHGT